MKRQSGPLVVTANNERANTARPDEMPRALALAALLSAVAALPPASPPASPVPTASSAASRSAVGQIGLGAARQHC